MYAVFLVGWALCGVAVPGLCGWVWAALHRQGSQKSYYSLGPVLPPVFLHPSSMALTSANPPLDLCQGRVI